MRRVYNKFMRRILYLSITKHLEIAVFAMVFVVGLRERYALVENLFQNRIQAVGKLFGIGRDVVNRLFVHLQNLVVVAAGFLNV